MPPELRPSIARTVFQDCRRFLPYTSFSLFVPDVDLPTDQSSVSINTEGITTVHRIFVALIGHPQAETYTVTPLDGTAAVGPLPL